MNFHSGHNPVFMGVQEKKCTARLEPEGNEKLSDTGRKDYKMKILRMKEYFSW